MLVYNLVITRRGNKGITNPARFKGLHTNRGKKDYKWRELKGFKMGAKRLQNGAREITNRGRDFKSGQGFQINAEQFKLVFLFGASVRIVRIFSSIAQNLKFDWSIQVT